MRKLSEIEAFLERETRGDYNPQSSHGYKRQWLIDNATYAKSTLTKMRGFGKLAWSRFLWAFELEEKTVLCTPDNLEKIRGETLC